MSYNRDNPEDFGMLAPMHNFPMLHAVFEFQRKMNHPMPDFPTALDRQTFEFRAKFLQEELDELCVGYEEADMEKQFDALIDIVYVALGTALLMGLWNYGVGFARVHQANMRKEPGIKPERPDAPFDAIKPPGWQAAVLSDLCETRDEVLEPRDPYRRDSRRDPRG